MALKPGGARLKGQRHEREVAEAFRTAVPEAARGIGQSRGGGEEVADVANLPLLHVECKHRQTISIWAAMAQATADAPIGKIPTVVVKQNRRENMVVMKLTDFIGLFEGFLAWSEAWKPSTEPTEENTVVMTKEEKNGETTFMNEGMYESYKDHSK